MGSAPLPSPWPRDRYEVRCALPAPYFATNDRYHFPAHAHEAVRRLQQDGLAMEIQVIRLGDGIVLFDLMANIDLPLGDW
jgi:hypothetical protein